VEQMLAQNPVDIRALRALGQIYDSQRQPDKATEKIRSYVAQRPNSAEAQSYLATRLLRSGQRADARFALLAAKGADPNASGPTLMLARLDAEDGKLDLARQSASAVLQSDPQSASAWMILGMVEEDSDHIPQAIDAYRKVLLKEPAHSLALNNLAFCLSRTSGGLDEALQYGQKAKEVAPESAAVADTLGWIYYQKQLYPSALRELQAAANAVDAPMVKLHLGLTYVQLGDKKRGVGLLEAAVKASPELRAQVPQSILEAMR
jgi:tetratricopeptide (TPR) repeat protein